MGQSPTMSFNVLLLPHLLMKLKQEKKKKEGKRSEPQSESETSDPRLLQAQGFVLAYFIG